MADRIIASGDARPIPPSEDSKTRSRLLAEVDGELETAGALADLVLWIESARFYVDSVRSHIEHRPKVRDAFEGLGFFCNSARWEENENTGLAFLQQAVSAHIRKARDAAAQVQR